MFYNWILSPREYLKSRRINCTVSFLCCASCGKYFSYLPFLCCASSCWSIVYDARNACWSVVYDARNACWSVVYDARDTCWSIVYDAGTLAGLLCMTQERLLVCCEWRRNACLSVMYDAINAFWSVVYDARNAGWSIVYDAGTLVDQSWMTQGRLLVCCVWRRSACWSIVYDAETIVNQSWMTQITRGQPGMQA